MAFSTQSAVSDGTLTTLNVAIGYIKQEDILVFYNGVEADPDSWNWVGATAVIAFTPAVPNGVTVLLRRVTQINQVINRFAAGAAFTNQAMDTDFLQMLYLSQEFTEGGSLTDVFSDLNMHGFKVTNLGLATAPTDAVSLAQYQADANGAAASAAAAAASAAAAQTSGSAIALTAALAAPTGAGLVGWIRNAVGAVATTVSKWLARQNVSLHDFMTDAEIADSQLTTPVLDHTAAIAAFFAQIVAGKRYYIPAGQFRFSSPLAIPYLATLHLHGEGRRASVFRYFGAATTGDLITFGDGSTRSKGFLSGFSVESDTTMTAGTGLRLKKIGQGFTVRDVAAGTNGGNRKLWDGIWFDNASVGTYTHFENEVQNDAVIVNGAAGTDEGSDIWFDYGLAQFSARGFVIGGGMGGYCFNNIVAFGNGSNYVVDNSRVARRNREGFFSRHCISDMVKAYGIHINDPLISNSYIQMDANIGSAGLVSPASPGVGLYVQSFPNGRIHVNSAEIFNCVSDGVRVDDASCIIQTSPTTYIFNNGGYGINATVATQGIYNNALLEVNTSGNLSANVGNPSWAGFATVVTAQTGTLTTVSANLKYVLVGGVCHFTVDILVTTNGTGANAIIFTLPKTPRSYANAYGREIALTGATLAGFSWGTNTMSIVNYTNAYPSGDGALLVLSGSFDYA